MDCGEWEALICGVSDMEKCVADLRCFDHDDDGVTAAITRPLTIFSQLPPAVQSLWFPQARHSDVVIAPLARK